MFRTSEMSMEPFEFILADEMSSRFAALPACCWLIVELLSPMLESLKATLLCIVQYSFSFKKARNTKEEHRLEENERGQRAGTFAGNENRLGARGM